MSRPVTQPDPERGFLIEGLLLAMVTVWAANLVVLKLLLGHLPPSVLAAWRFGVITLVAYAVLALRGGEWRVARADWPRLLASALSGIGVYQILFMEGLERTGAFASNLLQGTEPLFALLLLRATGAESVRLRQWAGVLLAVCGTLVFFLEGVAGQPVVRFGAGETLNLVSAASFAAYGLISQPLFARYPAPVVLAHTIGLGTLPLLAYAAPTLARFDYAAVAPGVWLVSAGSGLLAVYAAFWIWNWGIARRGLAHVSLYIFVDVVLSGVFARAFLGESFGALRLLGTATILAGLQLARQR